MALPGMLPDPRSVAEWPGAVSSKFRDKFTGQLLGRKKVDCHAAEGDSTSLARLLTLKKTCIGQHGGTDRDKTHPNDI